MRFYTDWLANPLAHRCVLVEVGVSISGVESTLYLSSNAYTDGVAGRRYQSIIQGDIEIVEQLSLDKSSTAQLSYGGIALDNINGDRDTWLTSAYVWRSRALTVLFGDNQWLRSDFVTVFSGVVADLEPNGEHGFILKLADKMQRLNTSLIESVIGGTGATATDLTPVCFGECFNIKPTLIDAATHRYKWHNGAVNGAIEVLDNGVLLDGARLPTHYATLGEFTLAGTPYGVVTLSGQGDKPSAYTDTIAGIIKNIVKYYGKDAQRLVDADIDLTNFGVFDAANTQAVGFYANARYNTLQACQDLAGSIGAQVVTSRAGLLKLVQIALPAVGTPVPLKKSDWVEKSFYIEQRIPVQSTIRLGYNPCWEVQTTVENGVPAEHGYIYAQPYTIATASDATITGLYNYDLAPPVQETLLIVQSEAKAEAARRLALYKNPRFIYRFAGSHAGLLALNLGDPVTITNTRFGLNNGKTGMIVYMQSMLPSCKTVIKVFGMDEASITPVYTLTPSVSTVDEGVAVTFAVTATFTADGAVLWFTTTGTVAAADFTDSSLTGSCVITSGAGSITRTLYNDVTTEGAETMTLQLRTLSTSGTVVVSSSAVVVNDTSAAVTYAVSPSVSAIDEGSAVTFTITTTGIANGTTLYWTAAGTNITTADFVGGSLSGSFTITSNSGSVVLTAANDETTEGAESFVLSIRTVSISGSVVATASSVTINDTSVPVVLKIGLFAFGYSGGAILLSNVVSNTGVIATDTTGVGTARYYPSACSYGGDKGLVAYGYNVSDVLVSVSNKISNTAVVATDTTGVGTSKYLASGVGYSTDKGMIAFGSDGAVTLSSVNLVSNTGVVATDSTTTATARYGAAACSYGSGKAIVAFGNVGTNISTSNLISDTGVVASDTTGVGTARYLLAACGYGGDKGIIAFGYSTVAVDTINLVSNTGVIASDSSGVGFGKRGPSACGFGNGEGIFAYSQSGGGSNKVSTTGVMASNVTVVGTASLARTACSVG